MKEVLSEPTPETDETQSRDVRVSMLAYQIWEEEGRPHGRHDVHWLLACEMIDAEDLAKQPPPRWLRRAEAAPENAMPEHEVEGTGDTTAALPERRHKRSAA